MDILEQYNNVFEDMVECYLENMEEEDKIKLDKEDIRDIAYKLIYKNEYIWEIINETIDMYISDILNDKEEE